MFKSGNSVDPRKVFEIIGFGVSKQFFYINSVTVREIVLIFGYENSKVTVKEWDANS